jgi:hypothetical protein
MKTQKLSLVVVQVGLVERGFIDQERKKREEREKKTGERGMFRGYLYGFSLGLFLPPLEQSKWQRIFPT